MPLTIDTSGEELQKPEEEKVKKDLFLDPRPKPPVKTKPSFHEIAARRGFNTMSDRPRAERLMGAHGLLPTETNAERSRAAYSWSLEQRLDEIERVSRRTLPSDMSIAMMESTIADYELGKASRLFAEQLNVPMQQLFPSVQIGSKNVFVNPTTGKPLTLGAARRLYKPYEVKFFRQAFKNEDVDPTLAASVFQALGNLAGDELSWEDALGMTLGVTKTLAPAAVGKFEQNLSIVGQDLSLPEVQRVMVAHKAALAGIVFESPVDAVDFFIGTPGKEPPRDSEQWEAWNSRKQAFDQWNEAKQGAMALLQQATTAYTEPITRADDPTWEGSPEFYKAQGYDDGTAEQLALEYRNLHEELAADRSPLVTISGGGAAGGPLASGGLQATLGDVSNLPRDIQAALQLMTGTESAYKSNYSLWAQSIKTDYAQREAAWKSSIMGTLVGVGGQWFDSMGDAVNATAYMSGKSIGHLMSMAEVGVNNVIRRDAGYGMDDIQGEIRESWTAARDMIMDTGDLSLTEQLVKEGQNKYVAFGVELGSQLFMDPLNVFGTAALYRQGLRLDKGLGDTAAMHKTFMGLKLGSAERNFQRGVGVGAEANRLLWKSVYSRSNDLRWGDWATRVQDFLTVKHKPLGGRTVGQFAIEMARQHGGNIEAFHDAMNFKFRSVLGGTPWDRDVIDLIHQWVNLSTDGADLGFGGGKSALRTAEELEDDVNEIFSLMLNGNMQPTNSKLFELWDSLKKAKEAGLNTATLQPGVLENMAEAYGMKLFQPWMENAESFKQAEQVFDQLFGYYQHTGKGRKAAIPTVRLGGFSDARIAARRNIMESFFGAGVRYRRSVMTGMAANLEQDFSGWMRNYLNRAKGLFSEQEVAEFARRAAQLQPPNVARREQEFIKLLQETQDQIIARVALKRGLNQHEVEELLQEVRSNQDRLNRHLYGVGDAPDDVDAWNSILGGDFSAVRTKAFETQMPNMWMMMDPVRVDQMVREFLGYKQRLQQMFTNALGLDPKTVQLQSATMNRAVNNFFSTAGDAFLRYWKAGVVATPRYVLRVPMFDEQLRFIADVGVLSSMEARKWFGIRDVKVKNPRFLIADKARDALQGVADRIDEAEVELVTLSDERGFWIHEAAKAIEEGRADEAEALMAEANRVHELVTAQLKRIQKLEKAPAAKLLRTATKANAAAVRRASAAQRRGYVQFNITDPEIIQELHGKVQLAGFQSWDQAVDAQVLKMSGVDGALPGMNVGQYHVRLLDDLDPETRKVVEDTAAFHTEVDDAVPGQRMQVGTFYTRQGAGGDQDSGFNRGRIYVHSTAPVGREMIGGIDPDMVGDVRTIITNHERAHAVYELMTPRMQKQWEELWAKVNLPGPDHGWPANENFADLIAILRTRPDWLDIMEEGITNVREQMLARIDEIVASGGDPSYMDATLTMLDDRWDNLAGLRELEGWYKKNSKKIDQLIRESDLVDVTYVDTPQVRIPLLKPHEVLDDAAVNSGRASQVFMNHELESMRLLERMSRKVDINSRYWDAIEPSSKDYVPALVDTLINQVARSELGRRALKEIAGGGDGQRVATVLASYLKTDRYGKKVADRLGLFDDAAKIEEHAERVAGMVMNWVMRDQDIAEMAYRSDANGLKIVFQQAQDARSDLLHPVHGWQAAASLDRPYPGKAAFEWYSKYIFELPTNKLSRQPFFKHWYSTFRNDLLEVARQQNISMTDDVLRRIESQARLHAIERVQQVMFDFRRNSRWGEMLSFIVPFMQPWKEAFVVWGHLLRKRPIFAERARVFMSEMEQNDWIYRDELTGESKIPLSNFWFMAPIMNMIWGGFGENGFSLSAPLSSWNFIFGSTFELPTGRLAGNIPLPVPSLNPALMPLVQRMADSDMLPQDLKISAMKWAFQYGDSLKGNSFAEAAENFGLGLFPTYLQHVARGLGFGDQNIIKSQAGDFLRLFEAQGMTPQALASDPEFARQMAGREFKSVEEAQQYLADKALESARHLSMFRGVLSLLMPAAPSINFPTRDLEIEYRALVEQFGYEEGKSKFLDLHPDNPLITIPTTYWANPDLLVPMPATREAAAYMDDPEFKAFAQENPQLAFAMLPDEVYGGEFDQALFFAQMSSGDRQVRGPMGMFDQLDSQNGYRLYHDAKLANIANLEVLRERGIPENDPAYKAEVAAFNQYKEAIAVMHPGFGRNLETLELGNIDPWTEYGIDQALKSDLFASSPVGQAIMEYRRVRNKWMEQMAAAGIHTLDSKTAEDLGIVAGYEADVAALVEEVPGFERVYNYLFNDDLRAVKTEADEIIDGLVDNPELLASYTSFAEQFNAARIITNTQSDPKVVSEAYAEMRALSNMAYLTHGEDEATNPQLIWWNTRSHYEKKDYVESMLGRPYIYYSRFDRWLLGEPTNQEGEDTWVRIGDIDAEIATQKRIDPNGNFAALYKARDLIVKAEVAKNPQFAVQVDHANTWGWAFFNTGNWTERPGDEGDAWETFQQSLASIQTVVDYQGLHGESDFGYRKELYRSLKNRLLDVVLGLKESSPAFAEEWERLESASSGPDLLDDFMPDTWYRLGG